MTIKAFELPPARTGVSPETAMENVRRRRLAPFGAFLLKSAGSGILGTIA